MFKVISYIIFCFFAGCFPAFCFSAPNQNVSHNIIKALHRWFWLIQVLQKVPLIVEAERELL